MTSTKKRDKSSSISMPSLIWLLFCSIQVVYAASCSDHDLETVYGTYDYSMKVTSYLYDIDPVTLDIAAAGIVGSSQYRFLYHIDTSACQVKWHFVLDDSTIDGFQALSIRQETGRVYGVASNLTNYYIFEVETDLKYTDAVTMQLYQPLTTIPSALIAPYGTPYTYIQYDNMLVKMTVSNTRPFIWIQQDDTGADNLAMAYTRSNDAMHVLQFFSDRLQVNKFLLDDFSSSTSLQSQLHVDPSQTPGTYDSGYISVFLDEATGEELISICSQFTTSFQNQVDIHSTKTVSDSSIVEEARLSFQSTDYECVAVNSGADSFTYVVLLDANASNLNLLKVSPVSVGTYTLATQQSAQTFVSDLSGVFLAQTAGDADQFFVGGVYYIGLHQFGLVLSAVDSRRTSTNTMWNAETGTSYDSSSYSSSFESSIGVVQLQMEQQSVSVVVETPIEPIDYHEYTLQVYNDSGEDAISDVQLDKSLQMSLRPANTTTLDSNTIYATFGMSIAETLVEVTDPEGGDLYAVVDSPGTYKLALWVNAGKTCLLSSMLQENVNAEVGKSTITIIYIDPITSAQFNVTYPLEILARDTYDSYVTLGIFEPQDSTTIDCSSSSSTSTSSSDDDDIDWSDVVDKVSDGGDSDDSSWGEEGDFDFGGGDSSDKGGLGGGGFGDAKGGGAGSFGKGGGGPGGSSSPGGANQNTVQECHEETYYEDEDNTLLFDAFGSESDLLDKFMESYGTDENFLRAYGGQVEFPDPSFDKTGHLSIGFSRPVVFPTSLLKEYDEAYVAVEPVLQPTQEELAQIKSDFEEIQADVANRPETISVQKTREVCEDVVLDTPQAGGGASAGAGDGAGGGAGAGGGQGGKSGSESTGVGDSSGGGTSSGGGGDSGGGSSPGGKLLRHRRNLASHVPTFQKDFDASLSLEDRLTVKVISEKQLDEETEQELQSYTWKIVSVDQNKLEIKIDFEYPEVVSADRSNPQFVRVKAFFSDFEPMWNDDLVLINVKLPQQAKELEEAEVAAKEQAQAIAGSGSNSVVGAIVFNILTSGAITQIWGMINSMQIYGNLPVFKQVSFPTYSKTTTESILEISSFEVIPLGLILDEVLDVPDDDGEEIQDTDAAALIEMDSYYFIMNLGSLFVVFLWMAIGMPLIFFALRPFRNKSEAVGKRVASLGDSLHGNLMIRYIVEGALDICVCIAFQFEFSEWNGGLNFNSVFEGINTVMTVIMLIAMSLFLPFCIIFYLCKFRTWGDKKFENQYGTIFDGLRKDKKSSLLYPLMHFIRRFSFTTVAILATDQVFVQVMVMLLTTLIQLMYLVQVSPFENWKMQCIEVFNEISSIILMYAIISFSDANVYLAKDMNMLYTKDEDLYVAREQFGFDLFFFCTAGINLVVHISLLMHSSISSIIAKIKKKCKRCSGKKEQQPEINKEHHDMQEIQSKSDDLVPAKLKRSRKATAGAPSNNVPKTQIVADASRLAMSQISEEDEEKEKSNRDSSQRAMVKQKQTLDVFNQGEGSRLANENIKELQQKLSSMQYEDGQDYQISLQRFIDDIQNVLDQAPEPQETPGLQKSSSSSTKQSQDAQGVSLPQESHTQAAQVSQVGSNIELKDGQ